MRRKGINMTSEKMRDNPLFMRNGYDVAGRWEIPVVRKQMVDFENIRFLMPWIVEFSFDELGNCTAIKCHSV